MKVFVLSAVLAVANASGYGYGYGNGGSDANSGYTTTVSPCEENPYGKGCKPTYPPNPCEENPYGNGCKPTYPPKPTYTPPPCEGYGCKPVPPTTWYPIPTITPTPTVPTITVTVPTVTVTVTATLAPSTTEAIKKLPQTVSCKKWNKKVNKGKCAEVNDVKCNNRGSKKSKYGPCNEATCCTGQETVTVTVAPAPTETVATIISCAQFCGKNGYQCQVATEGACALEGPFGDYLQCSKDLCCKDNVPVIPSPQIVSCAQVVAGNGWSCKFVPDFGCSVNGASGKYPACTAQLCCLFPIPPPRPNPCDYCTSKYGSCPPTCDNGPNPPNPCDACDLPYAYCPPSCESGNTGYTTKYY